MVPAIVFYAVWCLTALLASFMLTGRLIVWALGRGMIDLPSDRGIHARPTPRGGGLAIVVVTGVAAVLAGFLHPQSIGPLAAVLLPAAVVAGVSLIDDIHSLGIRSRLLAHVASAVVVTALVGPVERIDVGTFGSISLGPAAWPLTLLWIVGLTNAFNFMDGIDGIAGITAAAAGIAIAAVAAWLGSPGVAAVAAAFAASASGFLAWNWQPARIFMGDVGSTFCGFLLATLPLAMPADRVAVVLPVAILAVWPFVFDTAVTILQRLVRRENILHPHRSHIYQRLALAGWSHRAVAGLYGGMAAMMGTIATMGAVDPALRRPAHDAAIWAMAVGVLVLVGLRAGVADRGDR